MINGALSSSVHAGIVYATGLPAIRIRTPALHHLTIDLLSLWPMTQECHISISCRGWQRRQRWQVRRGARRLQKGRRRPSRRGFIGQRGCIGAERLDKRVKPSLQCRQDWGDQSQKACITKLTFIVGSYLFNIFSIGMSIFHGLDFS